MQIQIKITDKSVIDYLKKLNSQSTIIWEDIWGYFSISFLGKEIFKDEDFLFFEFYNAIRYWENHKDEDFIYDAIDTPMANPSIAFMHDKDCFECVMWANKIDAIVSTKELEQLCIDFKKELKMTMASINKQLTDEIVLSLLKQLETPYRLIYR